jgi:murein DD-endopeptidase MepM/ murein hydrolase activator NlpD
MKNSLRIIVLASILGVSCGSDHLLKPLRVVADLRIGESREIRLNNGDTVRLALLGIDEVRDSLRHAVRSASVRVSIDGEEITLSTGNYNLPVRIGKVQIDCPVTRGYYSNAGNDFWKLGGDARFRLWPKDSPYINPGTFTYPVKQRWFASMTQISNEPTYVDWGENYGFTPDEKIYYHAGHDIGGAEGFDEIISATGGLVVSSTNKLLEGYHGEDFYLHPDAVSVIDERGWIIEYAHLDSIFPSIEPGARVKPGQGIGFIGKQGSSGGWVHLHFEIRSRVTPSGDWGIEDAYPYMWEAYVMDYKPSIIAVARPHHFVSAGQEVVLDGNRSRAFSGSIVSYEWTFCDGTMSVGAVQKKTYGKPGEYSEVLRVTDSEGNVDYDFAVVQVYDPKDPAKAIPVMQTAYHPTLDIKAGDPVTFLVRTFNTDFGNEVWDFGDSSPQVLVKSYVDLENNTQGKFAETKHSFSAPGDYIVRTERSDESGIRAISHLHVKIEN